MTAEIIFLAAMTLAAYHYAVYPLAALFLARLKGAKAGLSGPDQWPSVTLVVAAFNEEKVIASKLENALALSYPAAKLDIVVVADGSTDRTVEIVRSFTDPRVRCLHDPRRRGKSHALNRAVETTSAAVVLLSDANNRYSLNAIEVLVTRLMQPGVGGVSGAKRIVPDATRAASTGDGLYWRYETRIKEAESAIGGTVTADGEIFALHRRLYAEIPPDIINDDMYLTFRVVSAGYRIEFDPTAVAVEEGSITIRDDFNVKVRMISGGFQGVMQDWRTVFASGWFSVRFFSHKILRWLMPVILATILVSNLWLLSRTLYMWIFAGQLAFYALAAVGWEMQRRNRHALWSYVPFYFVAMNLAAAVAIGRFIRGGHSALWAKAER